MILPNFLVIGAEKSGTTALYRYLKQHPMVFMSTPKEPNFFALVSETLDFKGPDGKPALFKKKSIRGIEAYCALFAEVKDEKAVGEASVLYFPHPRAEERIRQYILDARLIAVLRNPVEAAYSAFLMTCGFGIEPFGDFAEALRDQERRLQSNCFGGIYIEPRHYHRHLKRYLDAFGRDQVRIYLNENLKSDTQVPLKGVFLFLEVYETFVPAIFWGNVINVSGIPRSMALHRLLSFRTNVLARRIGSHLPDSLNRMFASLRTWNLEGPLLSSDLRSELIAGFREDILRLQVLIGCDLSRWLEWPARTRWNGSRQAYYQRA